MSSAPAGQCVTTRCPARSHGRHVTGAARGTCLAFALAAICGSACTDARGSAPPVRRHYVANSTVSMSGDYAPARLGFTIADVSTRQQLDRLPAGVEALVYVGSCRGTDREFTSRVGEFVGQPKVFGFYLMDEPDPQNCPAANLAQESAWIHQHVPHAVTFIVEQNLSSSKTPTYRGGYNLANTGVDLFGLDPYPCRSELSGCDSTMVGRFVAAAEAFGIPRSAIVPVFQAFGGGQWVDDGGGSYRLPDPAQARELLAAWEREVPHPAFDFVYSWGSQRGDTALETAPPSLQQVFAAHNRELTGPLPPPAQ